MNQTTCPIFSSGCPFSSVEENTEFRKYLDQCKAFGESCPFKDMNIIDEIKGILAGAQLSAEYSEKILLSHKNLSASDWSNIRAVCPSFSNGCIFAKTAKKDTTTHDFISCPVWKNGCPFKIMLSGGKRSLVDETDEEDETNEQKNENEQQSLMLAAMLKE